MENKNAMTINKYEKAVGLELGAGFPILFEDDRVTAKVRKDGHFRVDCNLFGQRSGLNKDGTHKKGCSYQKEVVVDISLYNILMSYLYLMCNNNNPRNPYYKAPNRETCKTFLFNRNLLLETNHGGAIIAKNVKYDRGVINFDIPNMPYPEGASDKEKDSIDAYNRRFGMFDGGHLTVNAATFAKAVMDGHVEDMTVEDLKEYFIRYTIYEYDDTVSTDKIAYICNAKNTMTAQKGVDIDSQCGIFQDVIPHSLRQGIEEKDGSAQYALELCKSDDDSEVDDEDSMAVYKTSLVSKEEYFRNILLAFSAAKSCVAFNQPRTKLILEDCRKGDEVFTAQCKKIVTETMDYGRTKRKALNTVRKDLIAGNPVICNSFLKSESLEDFWLNCYDFVLAYDYSDVPADIQEWLGIVPTKQNYLTPFTKSKVQYNMPILVRNMIMACYGYLSVFTPNTKGDTMDCMVDFRKFWDEKHNDILKAIYACRTAKGNDSTDSFCYVRNTNKFAVKMWYDIYMICQNYASKKQNKKGKTALLVA